MALVSSKIAGQDAIMQDASSPPAAIPNIPAESQLDIEFPNRPRNHGPTLPFSSLYTDLFNPLDQNRKNPSTTAGGLARTGRKQGAWPKAHEVRRRIISAFIGRWRREVGPDIFPAFRLVVPEKDKDRTVYGLKEKAIGRMLVKCVGIDRRSEDAQSLLNWRLPSSSSAAPAAPAGGVVSARAGDFAGRCFDVVGRRAMNVAPGRLTVADVNDMLDRLSRSGREEDHLPIFKTFYREMNAEEIMWLVRIILKQMKIGASEKTLFDVWHPDAESLFKVSSSLRRVCWELHDPNERLLNEDRTVSPMQIFQPQLAQFQMHDFAAMVRRMRPTENDALFWIEEKLDGERMQLHMTTDEAVPGGKRFAFWSRRAKEYTYLYGNGFYDDNGALTRHLLNVFHEGVESIILDGEMITWDPVMNAMVPFGTLKTAALSQQQNPRASSGHRPLMRVFDILYLNGRDLTAHDLYTRRKALEEAVISPLDGRFEIHEKRDATTPEEIEDALREVVAKASEGLVLKNPRSRYSLNDRNDDWMKVKPEYMTEYGEQLDCIVIGGYYGSGRRGGWLSSFLCGLKVDETQVRQGANPQKCLSFFKVGGGFMASDYATIRHKTEDKWMKFDKKRPPCEYIELAGRDRSEFERPDVWIKPEDSVVLSVKASSVIETDKFATGFSLRFPRFQKLREDRDWTTTLTVQDFLDLKAGVEKERQKKKEMAADDARKKRKRTTKKRALTVLGRDDKLLDTPFAGPATECFKGLNFFIIGGSTKPEKKSKAELEQLVKANGGTISQTSEKDNNVICIADANLVQVNALKKRGTRNVIRPSWLFDCIKQNEQHTRDLPPFLLPFEPKHMLFTIEKMEGQAEKEVDPNADSYARDTTPDELKQTFNGMSRPKKRYSTSTAIAALGSGTGELPALNCWILRGTVVALRGSNETLDVLDSLSVRSYQARQNARFAGATVSLDLQEGKTTHVVICGNTNSELRCRAADARREVSDWKPLPRIVGLEWVESCWKEKTRVDEERFPPF
ncbi:MAG: hypothetical protein LQ340_005356 [Diploschistes diacapsis]|nr:MAG: hypothetical protein LQ340_005356 [Diploschistes diacapsis]